jgi:SRSO17 transposase
VVERLGDPGAVLALDETGFVRKGTKSAGVRRQHSGTAGRVEDCRIGVFPGYAGRHGRAPIDRALHLPEGRAGDAGRRAGAGVPAEVAFATEPKLGRAMPGRASDAGVPWARVTGDGVCGADHAPRRATEARSAEPALGPAEPDPGVLAVTGGQRPGARRVDAWAAGVPPEGWRRLSAGEGAAARSPPSGRQGRTGGTGPARPAAAAPRPAGRRGCRSGASSTSRTGWRST